jgi:hypothetical protein
MVAIKLAIEADEAANKATEQFILIKRAKAMKKTWIMEVDEQQVINQTLLTTTDVHYGKYVNIDRK